MRRLVCALIIMSVFPINAVTPRVIFGTQYAITGDYIHGQYYVDINLTQDIGDLSIYGNYRNEMDFGQWRPIGFLPRQDYYTVGASYDFKAFIVRAEHMCMHPVVSQGKWSGLQGGYTRFEITLGD